MSRNVHSAACKCHTLNLGHKRTFDQKSHGRCNSNSVDWLCLHSFCTCLALAKAAVFAPMYSQIQLGSNNDNVNTSYTHASTLILQHGHSNFVHEQAPSKRLRHGISNWKCSWGTHGELVAQREPEMSHGRARWTQGELCNRLGQQRRHRRRRGALQHG
jgi:hypothetical protein